MKKLAIFTFLFLSMRLAAQDEISFSVTMDKSCLDLPVAIVLDNMETSNDSIQWNLYEITRNTYQLVNGQIEPGVTNKLWFVMEGETPKNSTRNFLIKKEKKKGDSTNSNTFQLRKADGNITLYADQSPVFSYRYETMFPPTGVDPLFKRSGFIHPLWSPKGEMLSRVQPPDHYHHYGIWGPWTLTHIGDREVDFWNLKKGEGTVKFAGFLSEITGSVFSGLRVLQQHIDFGAKGEDQIAMNEVLDVRVWNSSKGVWIIDYTTAINTPLNEGIMLDAYRYGGGIGYRATEKWTKENCTVLTSEGKTRREADGSTARWCIVEGESAVDEGRSGILFMSHPANRAHPEPMRVWPLDGNGGRGDLYFEFTPIRHQSWNLKNGNDYVLKYRMIVFDGRMDKETAEMYWRSFSGAPVIQIESIN
ncbi:MAG: PmoA family protein [Bacteroidales bacterium]|jgi:hypothetical protein|nr:PmoA family protein [Bacteroidales bacterium]MDD3105822.1 PmoA family protein [Bacteroidales bacterium]MDD3550196.1 PmoA family protein [Bacteroidales bacterium]